MFHVKRCVIGQRVRGAGGGTCRRKGRREAPDRGQFPHAPRCCVLPRGSDAGGGRQPDALRSRERDIRRPELGEGAHGGRGGQGVRTGAGHEERRVEPRGGVEGHRTAQADASRARDGDLRRRSAREVGSRIMTEVSDSPGNAGVRTRGRLFALRRHHVARSSGRRSPPSAGRGVSPVSRETESTGAYRPHVCGRARTASISAARSRL